MVAINTLSILALAGAVVAAPVANSKPVGDALVARDASPDHPWRGYRAGYSWRYGWGRPQGQSQPTPTESQPATETETETETVTVTSVAGDQGQSQSQPQSQPQQGSDSSSDSSTSTPSSTPSTPVSGGGTDDYMAIVNKYRAIMGKPAFTESSKLEANAQDCSNSSGGQLVHKLNPGSMGQVMAPGTFSDFESIFLGGWLCEIPSLVGGASVCDSASQGWNHAGQTGHAEILSSDSYTQIGCATGDGMMTCDVA
jgi:hypothetical protein